MFCGPAKTAALGVSLITSQYGDKKEHLGKLLVPLVLYQAEQVMTASFFVSLFKRWIREDEQSGGSESSSTSGNEEPDLEKNISTETGDNKTVPFTDPR